MFPMENILLNSACALTTANAYHLLFPSDPHYLTLTGLGAVDAVNLAFCFELAPRVLISTNTRLVEAAQGPENQTGRHSQRGDFNSISWGMRRWGDPSSQLPTTRTVLE